MTRKPTPCGQRIQPLINKSGIKEGRPEAADDPKAYPLPPENPYRALELPLCFAKDNSEDVRGTYRKGVHTSCSSRVQIYAGI